MSKVVGIPNQPARNGTYTQLATETGMAVDPAIGMLVRVHNSRSGFLVGRISEITEHSLTVTPEDQALRDWMPDGCISGRAHWHPSQIIALNEH